jgi:hypothetical protein
MATFSVQTKHVPSVLFMRGREIDCMQANEIKIREAGQLSGSN